MAISLTQGYSGQMPTYTAPSAPEYQSYVFPGWNYADIAQLARETSSPMAGQLRRGLRTALSQAWTDPFKREKAYSEALAGYGTGLANIQSQAASTALGAYGQKIGAEQTAAQAYTDALNKSLETKYAAETEEAKSAYQASLDKYNADVAAKEKAKELKAWQEAEVAAGRGWIDAAGDFHAETVNTGVGMRGMSSGGSSSSGGYPLSNSGYTPFDPSQW